MSWEQYNHKKKYSLRIYEKLKKVLSVEELEYFDICKELVSDMIINDEKIKRGA